MGNFYSEEFKFNQNQITIKKEKILKALEVPEDSIDSYLDEIIDKYTHTALEACTPRANYGLFDNPVFTSNTEMQLGDYRFSLGKIVLSALKDSSHIAVFVATAGGSVEELSKYYIKTGNLLEGLVLDIIGSEIAEETGNLIQKQIETDMLQRGFRITNRYSPGYCNWPVLDQQNLFALLGGHTCNVVLTESSLMIPIKSISGIIGVGTRVKNRGYLCSKCEVGACIYRDKR